MFTRTHASLIGSAALAALATLAAPVHAASIPYGPIAYDGDQGTYTDLNGSSAHNFAGETLNLDYTRVTVGAANGGHGVTLVDDFSTSESAFTISADVTSRDSLSRFGFLAYTGSTGAAGADGVYGLGIWVLSNTQVRFGAVGLRNDSTGLLDERATSSAALPTSISASGVNIDNPFSMSLSVNDTGDNATSVMTYSLTQGVNTFSFDLNFDTLRNAAGTSRADALIDLARDSAESTGIAFYGFQTSTAAGAVHSISYDNLTVAAIPEPTSLGLIGFAGLTLLSRRR